MNAKTAKQRKLAKVVLTRRSVESKQRSQSTFWLVVISIGFLAMLGYLLYQLNFGQVHTPPSVVFNGNRSSQTAESAVTTIAVLYHGPEVNLTRFGSRAILHFGEPATGTKAQTTVYASLDGTSYPVVSNRRIRIDVGELWIDHYYTQTTVTFGGGKINGGLVAVVNFERN